MVLLPHPDTYIMYCQSNRDYLLTRCCTAVFMSCTAQSGMGTNLESMMNDMMKATRCVSLITGCHCNLDRWDQARRRGRQSHNNKHEAITTWKRFLGYWPFVRGISDQWFLLRKVLWPLIIYLSLAWTRCWMNSPWDGDLRPFSAHLMPL